MPSRATARRGPAPTPRSRALLSALLSSSLRECRSLSAPSRCRPPLPQVKNLSLMAYISVGSPAGPILEYLQEWSTENLEEIAPSVISTSTKVFVNGVWVGVNRDPARLVKTLRELRRNMDVNTEACAPPQLRLRLCWRPLERDLSSSPAEAPSRSAMQHRISDTVSLSYETPSSLEQSF